MFRRASCVFAVLVLGQTLLAPAAEPNGMGSVVGIAVDARNRPVTNLTLYLVRNEPVSAPRGPVKPKENEAPTQYPPMGEQVIDKAVTDQKGEFIFLVAPSGAYLLRGGNKQNGYIYMDVLVTPRQTNNVGRIRLAKI